MSDVPRTLGEVIERNGRLRPKAPAITLDDDVWSHRDLAVAAKSIARELYSAGVAVGDRVAIIVPNHPMFLGLLFGTSLTGALPVIINHGYGPKDIVEILRHSGACVSAVWCDEGTNSEAVDELESARQRGALPDLRVVWRVGVGSVSSGLGLRNGLLNADISEVSMRAADVRRGDPALCIYTSGTTGGPKGVLLSHDALIGNAALTASLMSYSDTDILLPALPLSSSAGISLTLMSALSGTHIIVVRRHSPKVLLETIERKGVTILDMVPSGLKLLLSYNERAGHAIKSLRLVVVGGDASPAVLGQRVVSDWECNFATVYGLTETGPVVTITRLDDAVVDKIATSGQPIEGVDIEIRDEQGTRVPDGRIGEVYCRSRFMMSGYFRDVDATWACLDDRGWFATGDLGRIGRHNRLTIVGRRKEMICIGGHNVFPAEVESYLIRHPNIKDVAVIGSRQSDGASQLIAFVVPTTPDLDVSEVRAFCKGMAAFKLLHQIFLVESLPRASSSKVDKRKLHEMYKCAQSGTQRPSICRPNSEEVVQ